MARRYDVIVVGAGNAGLTAAATMAKAGKKTLLIEKHNLPGGCGTSFVRGRFEFEASLHELCMFGPEGGKAPVRDLFESFGCNLEWVKTPDLYSAVSYKDKEYDVRLPNGEEEFLAEMEKECPGSYDGLKKIMDYGRILNHTHDCMYAAGYKNDPVDMMLHHRDYMKLEHFSITEGFKHFGVPLKAIHILSNYWDYLAVDADSFSFPLYIIMLYNFVIDGSFIPKHRSFAISLAWDKIIRDNGGEIWYNTEVTKILVKDGAVYGVEVPGETIYSDYVIANLMPRLGYGKLIDPAEVPKRARKLENARRIAGRLYGVFLGLNKTAEELGITDYTRFIRTYGDTVKQYKETSTIGSNKNLYVSCPNVTFNDVSPEGTCIMLMVKSYTSDDWSTIEEKDYFKTKDAVALDCIKTYKEVMGIDLSDCIEEVEVSTPVTYARYIGTPQGAVYGYESSGWDGMISRVMDEERNDYMIKGLRFAGASGAILNGFSQTYLHGNAVAKLMLKDMEEGK